MSLSYLPPSGLQLFAKRLLLAQEPTQSSKLFYRQEMSKKILISAGELSGDEHAAQVVTHLKTLLPQSILKGMGGQHMRRAGVDTVIDSEVSGSVMGFVQVAKNIKVILKAIKEIKALANDWRPDLIILVDYPDFHFRIAKFAARLKIPVLFYISPTVWAWRSGRVKLVERYISQVAAIYPFEPDFYRSKGCNKATYVGHPFASEFSNLDNSDTARREFFCDLSLDPSKPTIAILPGSRKLELQRLLIPALQGFKLLKKELSDVQGIVPIASSLDVGMLKNSFPQLFEGDLCVTSRSSIDVLRFCDAGLLKSGTSNLQAAFCNLPFSMFYQSDLLSELIVRAIVPISSYSMVNIIRPGTIREIIQREVTPEILAAEMKSLLVDDKKRERIVSGLKEVQSLLSSFDDLPIFSETKSASERVARLALEMLP